MTSPDFYRPEKEKAKTKWRWLSILLVLIIILTYTFVPRDLEKLAGTKNISIEDVESIGIFAMHEAIFNIPEITTGRYNFYDEAFIEYVLSILEDRKVRKLWSNKSHYELTPPTDTAPVIDIAITFRDKSYTSVTIGYENRIRINREDHYLLYGDMIDLDELHDKAAALPEVDERDVTR